MDYQDKTNPSHSKDQFGEEGGFEQDFHLSLLK